MNKEDILIEVLKGISDMKQLGEKSISLDDVTPWGFDEVSKYVTTEFDKLGYRLYSYSYNTDDKNTPSRLKVDWR